MTLRSDAVGTTVLAALSVGPQSVNSNTTVNGSSTNVGRKRVGIVTAVGTRTDGTYTFKAQDSVDNSTFVDVPAANVGGSIGAISAANTVAHGYVLPQPGRPYVRVVCTSTSVTVGAVVLGLVGVVGGLV